MASESSTSREGFASPTSDLASNYESDSSTTDLSEASDSSECREFLTVLGRRWRVHALKLYRIKLDHAQKLPTLPCLDHEAQLHERIAPHCAAYIGDFDTNDLHEVFFEPARSIVAVDTISTMGEHTSDSHAELMAFLRASFPHASVEVRGPSMLRGDVRVAKACQAQVSLRDVLLRKDFSTVHRSIDRLRLIGTLMEKESRVASWSIRTITGPLLAASGVIVYWVAGAVSHGENLPWIEALRAGILSLFGGAFLYLGLKAVHLTGMSNRVWKRSCEYALLLSERQRLEREKDSGPFSEGILTPASSTDLATIPVSEGRGS